MKLDDLNMYYYIKNFGRNAFPEIFFKSRFRKILKYKAACDHEELKTRLNYYVKLDASFNLPPTAVANKDFKRTKGTAYYLDLKEFLHYFKRDTKFAYHFGDELHVNTYPTLFKARPLDKKNANSVLFKLDKRRHFRWVNDALSFQEKKDMMVWRGKAHQEQRKEFVKRFFDHPKFDVGLVHKRQKNLPGQKDFISIAEHLQYKFICCVEGFDVATNLKWAMSSNSLCVMPKPTCETWYMEGILKPGIHYVETKPDFSDVEEKMDYYIEHPDEAQTIIENAHRHVARFQDPQMEELLGFMVLEKYAELSGQSDAVKFVV